MLLETDSATIWKQDLCSANINVEDAGDHALIAACDRLVELRHMMIETWDAWDRDEDGPFTNEDDAEWWALEKKIRGLGNPTTIAGARAMSRVVVAHTHYHPDGSHSFNDIAEELTRRVAEFMAQA